MPAGGECGGGVDAWTVVALRFSKLNFYILEMEIRRTTDMIVIASGKSMGWMWLSKCRKRDLVEMEMFILAAPVPISGYDIVPKFCKILPLGWTG